MAKKLISTFWYILRIERSFPRFVAVIGVV